MVVTHDLALPQINFSLSHSNSYNFNLAQTLKPLSSSVVHFVNKPQVSLSQAFILQLILKNIPKQTSTMTKSGDETKKEIKKEVILPLVPEEEDPLTKANSVTFDLKTNPKEKDSPTYKFTARILSGTENARTIIYWKQDVLKVTGGLNITVPKNAMRIVETLSKGRPQSLFNHRMTQHLESAKRDAIAEANGDDAAKTAARTADKESRATNAMILDSINYVITQLVPPKSLQKVKRYLRRECRKPFEMRIRNYYQHLYRINTDEIPHLPPQANNQGLSEDDIIDILMYAVPKSWVREAEVQGFDPLTHRPHQIVDFLERIEEAEKVENKNKNNNNNNNNNKGGKRNGKDTKGGSRKNQKKSGERDSDNQKFCRLHGWGHHTTDECKNIKSWAEDAKKKHHGGKSWKDSADEEKKYTKKEVNAMTKQAFNKGVKKGGSSGKKRKSDDEESVNMADLDFDKFNFDDMQVRATTDEDELSC